MLEMVYVLAMELLVNSFSARSQNLRCVLCSTRASQVSSPTSARAEARLARRVHELLSPARELTHSKEEAKQAGCFSLSVVSLDNANARQLTAA